MTRRLAWMALLLPLIAAAQEGTAPKLPAAVTDILARAQIPAEHVAIVVREAGARENLIARNADKPMNPASVIKLLTTYAGLELLGPAYTWKTEVLALGEVRGGTLGGDLGLRGSGDPKLTGERFAALIKQLKDRGLVTIKGDLVLDTSLFEAISHNPAQFDGEPLKAYNVGPDALLVNYKVVRFLFAPTIDGRGVAIVPEHKPVQLEVVNRMRPTEGLCGEWRDRVVLDVQHPSALAVRVSFTGNYPKSCGERSWSLSLLDHPRHVGGLFAQAWRDLGGSWGGAVRVAPLPRDAAVIATSESPALAEIVRDINKFSNNVMARQLYLALSADGSEPASVARSTLRVRAWLSGKGIPAPELVVENGSGLSRNERISASTLAQMLDAAWRSSVMPEFISSMALAGVDGTMRRRVRGEAVAGQAHIKGGTLNDVRALAGFVLDQNGRRWIVVLMINHDNAGLAQAAQDALLKWVAQGPRG
ncbi:MAG TPA: D-alanyl-D-alanine carboxypeptidase/D-alanyl-D-alanine-endopeptidase [Usitatibacteraceae bacterium]|nr:D-alanyl-D-alanine carboxypeptidase/D-alanyl-D-alanine-endopeptidase [Usitatibacteraceae bacterium]